MAAGDGHEAVVQALIEAGVNVNFAMDGFGETAMHCAAENGHEAVVRVLIAAGAEFNTAANHGMTPLRCASAQGHEAVVRVLIEAGAENRTARIIETTRVEAENRTANVIETTREENSTTANTRSVACEACSVAVPLVGGKKYCGRCRVTV
jgi:ankyrin repeat protein